MYRPTLVFSVFLIALSAAPAGRADWKPAEGRMLSRFAKDVTVDTAWREYPRPQMVRSRWQNLNGLWDYALTPKDAPRPGAFDGEILVPFPIESALSGVNKVPGAERRLWYRRRFTVPPEWSGDRVILHFGAVDWHAAVSVNGKPVGEHKGGYTPFRFDITDALAAQGRQELIVSVWDPTDTWTQARGKQVSEPGGIWYTSVTGIWQTVWLEPVPAASIASLSAVSDIDNGTVRLRVAVRGRNSGLQVHAAVYDKGRKIAEGGGPSDGPLTLEIPAPRLWTPDSPHLYDLDVRLTRGRDAVDRVAGYFAMRKVSLGKDDRGFTRLMLNNRPVFMLGPLDQGWWPDGLYTAPTDEALRYDVEVTKKLGFNMARKHVKVEPARWYYHCDRLGLMVWQDMPNGNLRRGRPNNLRVAPGDAEDAARPADSARQFEAELAELIDAFSVFPSIVSWVPFNEGWGQYDSGRIAAWIENRDPSRLVNANSGWTDRGVGHVYDTHMYPGPGMEHIPPERATLLGEFGGLGWPVEGHLWWNKRNWGYRTYYSREDVNAKYLEVVGNVIGPIGRGLAAAVYTQTTDVEGEVNGLMTYDREIVKFDEEKLRALHNRLYAASGRAKVLLKTSEHEPQTWRYRFREPKPGWHVVGAGKGGWKQGPAPFQSGGDSLFPAGTVWKNGPIWMRKSFALAEAPGNLWLEAYHAVDKGRIYLNGKQIFDFEGTRPTRRHYHHLDLSEHAGLLRKGENTIAVTGKFSEENRGLDFGLYTLE